MVVSATRIVRYFGSYNYNLLRLIGIVVLFLPYIVVNWDPIYLVTNIYSNIFIFGNWYYNRRHIFIACLKRLGPRRQALLFSLQIPFTIVLQIFLQTLPQ